ncbi:MAG: hypothetical protein K9H25_12215 [Rhodospirillum sp.]|nr:hypothetical protein [Rhodospirillum sp.]MCF8490016.1 hypothetical protein [Rhodospirillum sp.]MCF8498851.1 hypothetical protein [Rhodospirillum sp.]
MLTRRAFCLAACAVSLATPSLSQAADGPIKLRDLYNKDRSFSDLAESLKGRDVIVEGFMAPPLKADAAFFVLTKMPLAVCPFCEPDTEWPQDILAIYTKRVVDVIPFNVLITVRGILELGPYTDPDTGFWSMARLGNARYERF